MKLTAVIVCNDLSMLKFVWQMDCSLLALCWSTSECVSCVGTFKIPFWKQSSRLQLLRNNKDLVTSQWQGRCWRRWCQTMTKGRVQGSKPVQTSWDQVCIPDSFHAKSSDANRFHNMLYIQQYITSSQALINYSFLFVYHTFLLLHRQKTNM